MNSLVISQTTNTNPTNCLIPNSQVNEIYKGLKQGEYLKVRLDKTEKTLLDTSNIMGEQKNIIDNLTQTNTLKDKIIKDLNVKCTQEKEIKNVEIERLQKIMELNTTQAKKEARRKSTNSFILGAGIGVTVTAVAILLLTK